MDKLLQQLKSLKQLTPDQEFLDKSRSTVLAIQKDVSASHFYAFQFKNYLRESMGFAAAVGLTALIIYIAASGFNSHQIKIAEQKKGSPDIHLENARYYTKIAPNVYVVVLDKEKTP